MKKKYTKFNFPLVSHHIGGRAGTRTFPILDTFEHDIINVLYEADQTALDQMLHANSKIPSKTLVFGDCLSGRAGPRDFFIYSNRYMSSLYRLLPKYQKVYDYDSRFKWDNDPGGSALVEKITIETVTLDNVMEREKDILPAPDFLSLDTQGSELEIIKGGLNTINSNVVAIQTEASLVPIYENQPLFGEIESYLRQLGFEVASFDVHEVNYMSDRTPIGFGGLGFPRQADVLFLRTEETMENVSDKTLSLLKQAFICFVYKYFDKTYEILSSISLDTFKLLITGDNSKDNLYLRFLEQIKISMITDYKFIFPVKYSDIFDWEDGKRRFSGRDGDHDFNKIYNSYMSNLSPDEVLQGLNILQTETHFGIEIVAKLCGFVEHSDDLRKRRLEQVKGLKNWLRLASS